MLLVYSLVLLIFLWAFLSRLKSNKKWSELRNIPGPRALPILGNVLDIKPDPKASLQGMCELSEQYDGIFKMHLGPQGWSVFISDPKYMEPILLSTTNINKGGLYNLFKDWLGGAIGIVNGDKWRNIRKVISATFNTKVLNSFCEIFDQGNRAFIQELQNHLDKPIDVVPLIDKNIFLQISKTLICDDINYEELQLYGKHAALAKKISMGRFFSLKVFDFIFKRSADCKQLFQSVGIIHDIFTRLIARRKAANSLTISDKKSLLDLLVDYSEPNSVSNSDREIIQHVDNIVFAAHDTTANSICAALFELSWDIEMQHKILKESNDIFGEDLSSELTMKGLESAEYLDMFCKEVLRKYPGAPMIARVTTHPLQLGEFNIPIGTNVMMLIYAMHMSPKYYPEPSKFDPERFSVQTKSLRSMFAHIPFSEGPRNCIGMRFGLLLFKSSLVSLIRNFIFLKGQNFELDVGQAGSLVILNGAFVKIQARK